MKRVRRYVAVLTEQRGTDLAQKIDDAYFKVCGGIGIADVQTTVLRHEEWGVVLRLRAATGRYVGLVPFVLSLVGSNGNYMQCLVTSGTIRGLRARLKGLGISMGDGMK